ncbi:MAG: hypothetical protein ACFCVK_25980 [Acidimicrobiales bacterium]
MATSPAHEIRNLHHATLDELELTDDELVEFHRRQAHVVAAVLADPIPSDAAFGK